jgi:LmbE family N-acetylglucosaminyl deacetylase
VRLFISPHLDDIALSCGGTARRLANQGVDTLAATLCTADAPAGQPLSPAARHEHWQWQLGDRPYEARRAEDARVMGVLGARHAHLGLLDAIYRRDARGRPLYEGKDFMSGRVHPDDWERLYPLVVEAIRGTMTGAEDAVYCPLTLGGHVDHVIVRRAVEAVCPPGLIRYYEDYPYAAKDPAALAPYLAGGAEGWRPTLVALTPGEIEARVEAILAYRSQLFALFGEPRAADAAPPPAVEPASVRERVREYIARVGGERIWERATQVR